MDSNRGWMQTGQSLHALNPWGNLEVCPQALGPASRQKDGPKKTARLGLHLPSWALRGRFGNPPFSPIFGMTFRAFSASTTCCDRSCSHSPRPPCRPSLQKTNSVGFNNTVGQRLNAHPAFIVYPQ